MIVLDKKSQIPLYEQLKTELIKLVISGKFKEGSKFYSLSEIAGRYQVSLITVRRVMSEMAAEGYLKTMPGRKALVSGLQRKHSDPVISKVAVFFYSPVPDGGVDYEIMPWTNLIYSGMQKRFMEKNILWTMVPVGSVGDAREKLAQIRDDHQAFIFLSALLMDDLIGELKHLKHPYLIVQPKGTNCRLNFVAADHFHGSAEVAEIAMRKNYRTFLYLSGSYTDAPEKLRGYQETLLMHDVSPQRIHLRSTGNIFEEAGSRAFEAFLRENPHKEIYPLAVYASGDRLAMGVLESCRKLGLKVPEQVGVAGGTGIPEAAHTEPPLTTMKIPMQEMGEETVNMICEMLDADQLFHPGRMMKVTLNERESL